MEQLPGAQLGSIYHVMQSEAVVGVEAFLSEAQRSQNEPSEPLPQHFAPASHSECSFQVFPTPRTEPPNLPIRSDCLERQSEFRVEGASHVKRGLLRWMRCC